MPSPETGSTSEPGETLVTPSTADDAAEHAPTSPKRKRLSFSEASVAVILAAVIGVAGSLYSTHSLRLTYGRRAAHLLTGFTPYLSARPASRVSRLERGIDRVGGRDELLDGLVWRFHVAVQE